MLVSLLLGLLLDGLEQLQEHVGQAALLLGEQFQSLPLRLVRFSVGANRPLQLLGAKIDFLLQELYQL